MTSPPAFGFAEWFRPGEYARTEQAIEAMAAAGATHLRTHLSWAEYHTAGGPGWYDGLLPKLAARFELLPCIHYTPPSLSRTGTAAGAPHRLQDYADFVDHCLTRYGRHFRAVELWNEPNNLLDWDWREDPDWQLFCEVVGAAAYWAKQRGFTTVLGGPCPFDAHWLKLMGTRGVLAQIDVLGLHGFPGTWDSEFGNWDGWASLLERARDIVAPFNPAMRFWLTEAGYATWRHDEGKQARSFLDALAAPAERLYWYGWQDIPDTISVQEGLRFDQRHYHMGAVDADGRPKLLARLLTQGGPKGLAETLRLRAPALQPAARPIVVAGGAGFIGCNLAESFLREGRDVVLLDNLSRPGVEENLAWLKQAHGDRVTWQATDLRDAPLMREVLRDAGAVFHLAAQTAVTTSLEAPIADFEVNARGTLNLLEAVRQSGRRTPVSSLPPTRCTATQGFDHERATAGADVVIVHEWTDPALVAQLGLLRRRGGGFRLLFHDTHHRAVSDRDAIASMLLQDYDGILAFGETLRQRYLQLGWGARVFTWHERAGGRMRVAGRRQAGGSGFWWRAAPASSAPTSAPRCLPRGIMSLAWTICRPGWKRTWPPCRIRSSASSATMSPNRCRRA